MKKTHILLLSTALLGAAFSTINVSAADGGEYTSNGAIQYIPSTDTTNPVDPLDPEKPVTPEDPTIPGGVPTPGTNGPLSIDFASSLDFGEQKITSETETYYAAAQKYKDANDVEKEGPNFVQVSDNRGTETGWTLNVKQNAQFKTAEDQELTGAEITLANGNIVTSSVSQKPTGAATITLDPSGSESLVMSAKAGQGAGTYLMDWGNTVDTAKNSISLEVPGSTTKYAKAYATTFTWTLTDVPGN